MHLLFFPTAYKFIQSHFFAAPNFLELHKGIRKKLQIVVKKMRFLY